MSQDRDELLQAAISVGTASELIVKTLLTTTSPSLLADRGDRDSLLLLAGANPDQPNALAFRSIAAAEAHRLAKHLHRTLPLDLNDLAPLTARNAAAHLAIVDSAQLRRAITQHCRLVQAVLPLLELDDEPYWGADMHATVVDLVDEAKTEAARLARAKIAAAVANLAQRLRGLPIEAQTAYRVALSGQRRSFTDHEEPHQCPACGEQGWLLCGIEHDPPQYDTEYGYTPAGRTAYPFAFECPVCDLDLEGDEIDEVAGLSDPIELEPDPDADEGWVPDEDFIRGR